MLKERAKHAHHKDNAVSLEEVPPYIALDLPLSFEVLNAIYPCQKKKKVMEAKIRCWL